MLINQRIPIIDRTLFNCVCWMLGFFSTSSIATIPIGGRLITFYEISLFLFFVVILSSTKRKKKKKRSDKLFSRWIVISIVSSLFGFLYFYGNWEWQFAAIKPISKLFIYFIIYKLLNEYEDGDNNCRYILNGILLGMIFNILTSVLDAVGFYVTGDSLINNLFSYYINMKEVHYDMISIIMGPTIRSCGLNYDPANIGMFVPIIAMYGLIVRKYALYFLSILGVMASISHTGFVGVVVVTFVYFTFISKGGFYKTALLFLLLSIVLVLILSVVDIEALNQMEQAFVDRTESKMDSGQEMEGARGMYWRNFIPAIIGQPSSLIIGTGYATASYAYLKHNYVVEAFRPFDPEQTYFSTFFDIGLWGLLIFIFLMVNSIENAKKNMDNDDSCKLIFSALVGAMVVFLSYHYTLYSVFMLIIISSLIIKPRVKVVN